MRRKLLLLNAVLLAATVYGALQLRNLYRAAKAREAAVLQKKVKPLPPPPMQPLAPPPAVMPSGYADIAQKMLFDKSRNPEVPVEVVPPPPPKPVPPFPYLKGMMNLGDGLTAVFAEKSGGPGKEIKPGEKIGQFTLVAVNEQEAVFEWDGKQFHKRVEEIMDHPKQENTEPARPATPAAGVPPPPTVQAATGPGVQTGDATRACTPSDSSPAGAVVDGYRKVVVSTPFGQACRWEAVSK